MEKTSHEIDLERAEKEKEIFVAEKNRDSVEEKIIELRQKIAELRTEIHKWEIARIKAKEVVAQLKLQNESLKRAFWAARNSGV